MSVQGTARPADLAMLTKALDGAAVGKTLEKHPQLELYTPTLLALLWQFFSSGSVLRIPKSGFA
ncbi:MULTISPECIES: hypothetical protein [unclassified Mesorhizobium]|uniref:hypothetical protein n=1 Tax=unclassified Mesorhizobium TaxID=325217 RepID=UPI003339C55F